MSRGNEWNKLIFGVLIKIQESQKLTVFWWWWSKNGLGFLGLGTLKSAVSQELIDEMS